MFVIQNRTRPGEIQNALRDLMRDGVESVRVCSAYVTRKGSELLYDEIRRSSRNGDQDAVSKTIVASLDFGTTEPQALEYWMEIPGSRVLVAGADLLERRSLNPKVAFHPKVYAFRRPNGTVGSLGLGLLPGVCRGFKDDQPTVSRRSQQQSVVRFVALIR